MLEAANIDLQAVNLAACRGSQAAGLPPPLPAKANGLPGRTTIIIGNRDNKMI